MDAHVISVAVPPAIALLAAFTNDRRGIVHWGLAAASIGIILGMAFAFNQPQIEDPPSANEAASLAFVVLPTTTVFGLLRTPGFRGRRIFSFLVGTACYMIVLLLGIGFALDLGFIKH